MWLLLQIHCYLNSDLTYVNEKIIELEDKRNKIIGGFMGSHEEAMLLLILIMLKISFWEIFCSKSLLVGVICFAVLVISD